MNKLTKEQLISEFLTPERDIIHSTYQTVNPKTTSKSTTDDHIGASRQGMVWMNYRRYYGENAEELPYNDVADACAKDPKAFYNFLIDNNEDPKLFEKYFTYDETNGEDNMRENILKIRNKNNDIIPSKESLPTLDELEESEPLIIGKLKDIISFVNKNFDDNQKTILLDYIKENIKHG